MTGQQSWLVRGEILGPRPSAEDGSPPPPFDTLLQQWAQAWPWQAAPLAVAVQGERFAGSLSELSLSFDFTVAIQLQLWPVGVRVGIGDGALRRAREQKLPFALELPSPDPRLRSALRLIEQAARLHAAQMARWKPSRAAAVRAIRQAPRQQDAAALLGIRQQSISDALRAAMAGELSGLEAAIRDHLKLLQPPV